MRRLLLILLVLLVACEVDVAPTGLRATPAGNGPHVRFSMPADIPLPNDVATAPDPTSRTGRRPSPSFEGTTALERELRADFAAMEGWGVYAPISVGFDRSPTVDVRTPALDLDSVLARMANDEHDPSNDPFYVVNLTTGIPALLDVGANYSPLTLRDPFRYGPNDPKASEPNLFFETVEEGAGLPELLYQSSLDRDFDGILDHPNLYDWYERETDTLLLRPIVPLAEMTEYAVVLTDRLRGPDGQLVTSPFPDIYHPSQRAGVTRLRDWLTDKRLTGYYGDIAGTGLAHIAFAWTFTTQPTRSDLRALREGLYGNGAFGHLAKDYPATAKPANLVDRGGACPTIADPTVLKLDDPAVRALVQTIAPGAANLDAIDHVVVGTFRTPYLLGNPNDTHPDSHFAVNFQTGEASFVPDEVPFVLVLPKAHVAPFPVAILAPSDHGNAGEVFFYAGDYARQGVAMLAYDLPNHGLVLPNARPAFAAACVGGFYDAITKLHGTGANAPWWTGHVAHDRDVLRQGVLDGINAVRIARAFGGLGPNVFALGSMTSSILGAVEPLVTATAPISNGGGLAGDIALKSAASDPAANARVLGPWVFSVPAAERADTKCQPAQRSVRISGESGETELACLNADELAANQTIIVSNVTSKSLRCARTARGGRFVVPIPTTTGDRLDIQVYEAPDVVNSYGICEPQDGAPAGRRIKTFELTGGDDLVAPMDGLGIRRQSPALRRFRDVAQAMLDPADPIAFATAFMLDGAPRPLLSTTTIGDADVPIAAQLAFARAAGAIPFLPPSAADTLPAYADYATPASIYSRIGNRSPMRYLVDTGVLEGVARLGRTTAGPACKPNGCDPVTPYACDTALFDPDWTSEGAMLFDQPHADAPLRLARIATIRTTNAATLAAGWAPRLAGIPFAPDSAGWTATAPVVGVWNAYEEPGGAHAWTAEAACRAWDPAMYGNALLARFFATGGRDVYYLSHPSTHACLAAGTCDFSH